MEGNVQHVVKQVSKFAGKNADDFIKWSSKLRVSLSLYSKTIFEIVQGSQRPSGLDSDQVTACEGWDDANYNSFSILYFTISGPVFSVVRRFEGKRREDGVGCGQYAWSALRRKFDGCSREALRAAHRELETVKMRSDEDPDDFLHKKDRYRDRLDYVTPKEGPSDRRYEDIILQYLPPEYDRIRQTPFEREDCNLEDIRRMVSKIYADNLVRSHFDSSRGIVGRGVAMQATGRDVSKIYCYYCNKFGHYKNDCADFKAAHHQNRRRRQRHHKQRGWHQPDQPKPDGQQQQRGEGQMWCSYHKTTTHNDADCRTTPANGLNGNAHFAQVRPPSVPGICSSWDLPVRDDSDEKPCISFLAREVQSAAKPAKARVEEETGARPLGPVATAAREGWRTRSWPFTPRAKQAISFGGPVGEETFGVANDEEPVEKAFMAPSSVAVTSEDSANSNLATLMAPAETLPGKLREPLSGGASTPLSGGASTPLSGGAPTPLSGGASTPLSGGASTPLSGGASTPLSGGATPLSGGASTPSFIRESINAEWSESER